MSSNDVSGTEWIKEVGDEFANWRIAPDFQAETTEEPFAFTNG